MQARTKRNNKEGPDPGERSDEQQFFKCKLEKAWLIKQWKKYIVSFFIRVLATLCNTPMKKGSVFRNIG